MEVGKFFGHDCAEPVAHEGPEKVAAGIAAFDFAAEVGVTFENDVGAMGELANPVARKLVVKVEAGFFDYADGDCFGDDDQRFFASIHWAGKIQRKGAKARSRKGNSTEGNEEDKDSCGSLFGDFR